MYVQFTGFCVTCCSFRYVLVCAAVLVPAEVPVPGLPERVERAPLRPTIPLHAITVGVRAICPRIAGSHRRKEKLVCVCVTRCLSNSVCCCMYFAQQAPREVAKATGSMTRNSMPKMLRCATLAEKRATGQQTARRAALKESKGMLMGLQSDPFSRCVLDVYNLYMCH